MLSWLGCCRDRVGALIFGIVGDGGIGVGGVAVVSIGGVIGGI